MTRTALKVLVVLGLVVGFLASVLWADAQVDLDSAKRDYESLKSKTDELKDKVDKYLEQSREIAVDGQGAARLAGRQVVPARHGARRSRGRVRCAKDLTDKVVRQRSSNVRGRDPLRVRHGRAAIERHLDSVKALRNRAKIYAPQDAIKDGASRLSDDAEKLVEVVDRLMEKVQTDFRTLDRVKDGVMSGANNPVIRAKMEYGKEKHRSLQSSRSCDEREVVLSSGRPVRQFESDNCRIIEFKPEHVLDWRRGDPGAQVRRRRPAQVQGRQSQQEVQARCGWLSNLPAGRRDLHGVQELM